MEETRTYAVKIGLVVSLVKGPEDGDWWEDDALKEALAERCIDFIKTGIEERPECLAALIDEVTEIDRRLE